MLKHAHDSQILLIGLVDFDHTVNFADEPKACKETNGAG